MLVALSADADADWASDPALVAELETGHVPVRWIGDTFHRDPLALADAARALKTLTGTWTDLTVAHAHTAMTGAVACWAGARRIAVTCHGWNLRRPAEHDLQDALALTLVDAVISPSSDWAKRLETLPGIDHVTVIPNGFDLSRYPALPRHVERGPRPPRIVCVGELTHRKGQDVLVRAMPLLWRTCSGATLDVVGDGDMAADLQRLAHGVDAGGDRIRFSGHLPRPYASLADADVFCLPSRSDNQPVAIVEALLAGLPVVSTRVGGIPEMIDGAQAGEIVPAESPEALAEALERVLARSDREELSQRTRDFARHQYGVAVMADRIEALYRSSERGERAATAGAAVADPLQRS